MWYSSIIEAMSIFEKYNRQGTLKAEHGIIYTRILTTEVDSKDKEKLFKLGWHEDHGFFAYFA